MGKSIAAAVRRARSPATGSPSTRGGLAGGAQTTRGPEGGFAASSGDGAVQNGWDERNGVLLLAFLYAPETEAQQRVVVSAGTGQLFRTIAIFIDSCPVPRLQLEHEVFQTLALQRRHSLSTPSPEPWD